MSDLRESLDVRVEAEDREIVLTAACSRPAPCRTASAARCRRAAAAGRRGGSRVRRPGGRARIGSRRRPARGTLQLLRSTAAARRLPATATRPGRCCRRASRERPADRSVSVSMTSFWSANALRLASVCSSMRAFTALSASVERAQQVLQLLRLLLQHADVGHHLPLFLVRGRGRARHDGQPAMQRDERGAESPDRASWPALISP